MIRLTVLLAFCVISVAAIRDIGFLPGGRPAVHRPVQIIRPDFRGFNDKLIAITEVQQLRQLLIDNIATYENARFALETAYAQHAEIFFRSQRIAVGPKEFLPLFWQGTKDAKVTIFDVQLDYNEDTQEVVEKFKSTTTKDGKSTSFEGTRYWRKTFLRGYQIVQAYIEPYVLKL